MEEKDRNGPGEERDEEDPELWRAKMGSRKLQILALGGHERSRKKMCLLGHLFAILVLLRGSRRLEILAGPTILMAFVSHFAVENERVALC